MFKGVFNQYGELIFLFLIYIRFNSPYRLKLYPGLLENASYPKIDWSLWNLSVSSQNSGQHSHAIFQKKSDKFLLLVILIYPFSCKRNNEVFLHIMEGKYVISRNLLSKKIKINILYSIYIVYIGFKSSSVLQYTSAM